MAAINEYRQVIQRILRDHARILSPAPGVTGMVRMR